MRSIVVWLLLIFVLLAVVSTAVNGDSICNEAIESLEATLVATLEAKFDQLKAEIKENFCHENTTGNGYPLIFYYITYILHHFNAFCCIFSCQNNGHILRVRKCTRITSERVIQCPFLVKLTITKLGKNILCFAKLLHFKF